VALLQREGAVEVEQEYQTMVVKVVKARTQILYPAHLLIILGKIQFLTPARAEPPVVALVARVVFILVTPIVLLKVRLVLLAVPVVAVAVVVVMVVAVLELVPVAVVEAVVMQVIPVVLGMLGEVRHPDRLPVLL
jgi:hypothetical protein